MKIEFERELRGFVIGVDECNYCTSMAGDCVAAACWLPLDDPIPGIDDSKMLTHKKRIELFARIVEKGLFWVVPASACAISKGGLKKVRDIAMSLAVQGLLSLMDLPKWVPVLVLVDGQKDAPQSEMISLAAGRPITVEHIVDGDKKSYLVGAASIVAKVYTDALFAGYDQFWSGYGIGRNHGSMSTEHRKALQEKGPSPVHRVGYAKEWWERLLRCG